MTGVAQPSDSFLVTSVPLDIESLLKPISQENPAGINVRYEPIYDEINKARREDEDLPRGIWEINLKKAQWDLVELHCKNLLTQQSKDLQVAAWLVEAWLCRQGLGGLAQGFVLLTRLCETFWPTLHPEMAQGDVEFRLSILEWVNEKLTDRLILIPMTAPAEIGGQVYLWAEVVSAGVLELQAKRHPEGHKLIVQAQNAGEATLERVGASALQTPAPFYQQMLRDIEGAQESILAFEKVLHECYPDHPHSFYKIRNALKEMVRFIESYQHTEAPEESALTAPEGGAQGAELQPSAEGVPEAQEASEEIHVAPKSFERQFPPAEVIGKVTARDQAYELLSQIAEYLGEKEPHSPTPLVLKRVSQWGHMSLPELLADVKAAQVDLLGIENTK